MVRQTLPGMLKQMVRQTLPGMPKQMVRQTQWVPQMPSVKRMLSEPQTHAEPQTRWGSQKPMRKHWHG
jgi:hypothetical protein